MIACPVCRGNTVPAVHRPGFTLSVLDAARLRKLLQDVDLTMTVQLRLLSSFCLCGVGTCTQRRDMHPPSQAVQGNTRCHKPNPKP